MKKNSHEYEVIHENEIGFITRCTHCDELQICLGNLMNSMPVKAFPCLVKAFRYLDHCEHVHRNAEHKLYEKRPYILRTPIDSIFIAFTKTEFEDALELLNMVAVILEAEKALQQN